MLANLILGHQEHARNGNAQDEVQAHENAIHRARPRAVAGGKHQREHHQGSDGAQDNTQLAQSLAFVASLHDKSLLMRGLFTGNEQITLSVSCSLPVK